MNLKLPLPENFEIVADVKEANAVRYTGHKPLAGKGGAFEVIQKHTDARHVSLSFGPHDPYIVLG